MKTPILLLLAALAATAQTTPVAPTAVANASISGVVRDKATGTPLKD